MIKIPTTSLKEIDKALDSNNYKFKLLPATKRHSCEIILPKKWEGSRIIIIKLD
jgi:hypothetical protein